MKSFLVWNIYFTFFLSVIDCTFYKSILLSILLRVSYQGHFIKSILLRLSVYYYVTYASEAVDRCSIKRAFLESSQNSQKKTCARVSLSKNTFSYSTPLVAASGV